MKNNGLPQHILFLARSESSVRMDTAMLRAVGITSFTLLYSKEKALAHLQTTLRKPDIVLCSEQLEDGPIISFLLEMGHLASFAAIPLLLFASSTASAAHMELSGIPTLQRPYTQNQLAESLAAALAPTRPRLNTRVLAACALEKAPPQTVADSSAAQRKKQPVTTTSDLYADAVAALQRNDLTRAENIFREILHRNKDHIDACIGLACVYNKQDNQSGTTRMLLRAAANAIRQRDYGRAEKIMGKLPERYHSGNIFAHEAASNMNGGDYQSAALGFLDATRSHDKQPLHSLIARACQFTPNPEQNMERLCTTYEKLGHEALAKNLRHRLLQMAPTACDPPPSWLDKFPLVRDVVQVAAFTTSAWRHA